MFTVPFAVYFGALKVAGLSSIWSGIAAIGSVHLVIVSYVVMAFTEDLECDYESASTTPGQKHD